MTAIYLPVHYRLHAEILRTRDNGNYDISVNGVLIGNVEPRHLEVNQ